MKLIILLEEIDNDIQLQLKQVVIRCLIPFKAKNITSIPLNKIIEQIIDEINNNKTINLSLNYENEENVKSILEIFDELTYTYDLETNTLLIDEEKLEEPTEEPNDEPDSVDKAASRANKKDLGIA